MTVDLNAQSKTLNLNILYVFIGCTAIAFHIALSPRIYNIQEGKNRIKTNNNNNNTVFNAESGLQLTHRQNAGIRRTRRMRRKNVIQNCACLIMSIMYNVAAYDDGDGAAIRRWGKMNVIIMYSHHEMCSIRFPENEMQTRIELSSEKNGIVRVKWQLSAMSIFVFFSRHFETKWCGEK